MPKSVAAKALQKGVASLPAKVPVATRAAVSEVATSQVMKRALARQQPRGFFTKRRVIGGAVAGAAAAGAVAAKRFRPPPPRGFAGGGFFFNQAAQMRRLMAQQ